MEAFNPSVYTTDQHTQGGMGEGSDVLSTFRHKFDGQGAVAKTPMVSEHIQFCLEATHKNPHIVGVVTLPVGKTAQDVKTKQ